MASNANSRGRSGRTGSWAEGKGKLWGALAAGVVVGFAANLGRKAAMQAVTGGATGDWFEALKTEHRIASKLFDLIEATEEDQTVRRGLLLAKLKYSLSRHALEEEDVVYPALREGAQKEVADKLNHDHGYIKTYLYELLEMPKDSPAWIVKLRELRTLVEEHVREEEDDIYPAFHARQSDEQNARLTALLNKEGFSYN